MGEDKEDRRVVRTRQLLREALVSLILERGYEAVTVQDILDRANLGRSTFYAHFRNKDDLMFSGFEQFAIGLHAHTQGAAGEGLSAFTLHLFRHVEEARRLLKALWGRQGSRAILKRSEIALSAVLRRQIEQLAQGRPKPAVPLVPIVPIDIAVHYAASSLMSLITLWLDCDLPYTAEQMDAMFRQLTMPGLMAALGLED
jgi:AcrR family transcriptional regulator